MRKVATAVAALVLLAGCYGPAPTYSSYQPTPTPSPPAPTIQPGAPFNLTAQQQQMVRADTTKKLKDPESARFGRMYATKDQEGDITVCGFVNAKNSYGGYTGMKPFIGMILRPNKGAGFKLIDIGSSDTVQAAVVKVCRDSGITLSE